MSEPDGYDIAFTLGARGDLAEIANFMAGVRGNDDAAALVRSINDRITALRTFPLRGGVPKELQGLQNRSFRQLVHRQHRIVYTVTANLVVVLLIADGRRDMQALFHERGLIRDAEP